MKDKSAIPPEDLDTSEAQLSEHGVLWKSLPKAFFYAAPRLASLASSLLAHGVF